MTTATTLQIRGKFFFGMEPNPTICVSIAEALVTGSQLIQQIGTNLVKATKTSASPRHEGESVQDSFLQSVVKKGDKLTIFLVNGVKLSGQITQYDTHTIILTRDNQSQLVYKHAVSTILPGSPLPMFSKDDIDDI